MYSLEVIHHINEKASREQRRNAKHHARRTGYKWNSASFGVLYRFNAPGSAWRSQFTTHGTEDLAVHAAGIVKRELEKVNRCGVEVRVVSIKKTYLVTNEID